MEGLRLFHGIRAQPLPRYYAASLWAELILKSFAGGDSARPLFGLLRESLSLCEQASPRDGALPDPAVPVALPGADGNAPDPRSLRRVRPQHRRRRAARASPAAKGRRSACPAPGRRPSKCRGRPPLPRSHRAARPGRRAAGGSRRGRREQRPRGPARPGAGDPRAAARLAGRGGDERACARGPGAGVRLFTGLPLPQETALALERWTAGARGRFPRLGWVAARAASHLAAFLRRPDRRAGPGPGRRSRRDEGPGGAGRAPAEVGRFPPGARPAPESSTSPWTAAPPRSAPCRRGTPSRIARLGYTARGAPLRAAPDAGPRAQARAGGRAARGGPDVDFVFDRIVLLPVDPAAAGPGVPGAADGRAGGRLVRAVDLIRKKRDGGALSEAEPALVHRWIRGGRHPRLPGVGLSAWPCSFAA